MWRKLGGMSGPEVAAFDVDHAVERRVEIAGKAAVVRDPNAVVRDQAAATTRARLVSLDVFRGLTVAAMVIVNNPGDWGNVYAPLLHAEWNGWTPTDLIFPFFLFIVGVSITMSRQTLAGWASIVRRGVVLIGLGLFLAGFPAFTPNHWRIPGVLQRIGVCYLVAATLYKTSAAWPWKQERALMLISGVLLAGYWAVMMLTPNEHGVRGDLSPEGNVAAMLDRALLSNHLWRPRWDPEGLLSTVPAIATTLFGICAGLVLRLRTSRSLAVLALWGSAGIVIGEAWHLVFPINKNLWTSSYAVFTAGAATLLLILLYWWIDVRGHRRATHPFVVLGLNAIALFALSALLVKTLIAIRMPAADGTTIAMSGWIYQHWFVPLASPKNASLLYAAANLALLYGVLWVMYRKRVFIKI
ncbi:MAG TPA: heparan-alpha-glucosaminide N-acetyltransferase domain-containing protein [Vicinamibacterales bacterium]|nr:heparan-alpha-glucosaminide N-acetyltransferase domain-containing protein [Vicinamibacterales bacterium]